MCTRVSGKYLSAGYFGGRILKNIFRREIFAGKILENILWWENPVFLSKIFSGKIFPGTSLDTGHHFSAEIHSFSRQVCLVKYYLILTRGQRLKWQPPVGWLSYEFFFDCIIIFKHCLCVSKSKFTCEFFYLRPSEALKFSPRHISSQNHPNANFQFALKKLTLKHKFPNATWIVFTAVCVDTRFYLWFISIS